MYKDYSVLMSVYRKEKPDYLIQSIESILNQSLPTNDFVIVEDGVLTQELNDILNGYEKGHECIRLVKRKRNDGLGAALNLGLGCCKNELVARMDSDDISVPERCEKEVAAFNEDASLDIVGTALYEFCEDENNVTSMKRMPLTQYEIRKYAARRNPFNHPTVMYKKDVVLGFGGYTEGQRGEDFELFTKMVFLGAGCKNLSEPLLKYRAVDGQYERRTSAVETKAVIRVAKKNYKNRYIKCKDYVYVAIVQLAAYILPKKLGKAMYRKKYRKQII